MIVLILLVFQVVIFVSLTAQISRINSQQGVIKEDIDNYVSDLRNDINEVGRESRFGINSLSREISDQKSDIQEEIELLKSSQEDFSSVIDQVIKGVVSVVTDRSAGSGFVVNSQGYIVTNWHVIQESSSVEVHSFNNVIYEADVVGFDRQLDLALLKVDAGLEKLPLADSDEVQIGEKVIAIGNPLGLSFSVTEGIVSAVERVGPNGMPIYVQTDVSLNRGNSGGPLINRQGEVVGINNFKIGGNTEGLGFALESDVVRQEINELHGGVLI